MLAFVNLKLKYPNGWDSISTKNTYVYIYGAFIKMYYNLKVYLRYSHNCVKQFDMNIATSLHIQYTTIVVGKYYSYT